MPDLAYFTVVSNGLHSIGIDYVDPGTDPDEAVIYAFVTFTAREPAGTVHWLSTATVPRGIVLDPIKARYRPEDGKLATIIASPTNEQQSVTPTGTPFTLSYLGVPTGNIASTADPGAVQAALEALSSIGTGNCYVYKVMTNEKQRISFSGGPTGGQYTLATAAHPTVPTVSIGRSSNAGYIQQALQELTDIGPDGCSVVGPVGGPYDVEFTGLLSGVDVGMLVANSAGLTPPGGTVVVSQIVAGSSSAPFKVNFIGALQGTNVAQLTATNATVSTLTEGNAAAGVELVANTPVLELGLDQHGDPVQLIYDVVFDVPDLDSTAPNRTIAAFGITAPTTGGSTVDLATVTKLPPKGR